MSAPQGTQAFPGQLKLPRGIKGGFLWHAWRWLNALRKIQLQYPDGSTAQSVWGVNGVFLPMREDTGIYGHLRYLIREVHDDYLTCRTLATDGTQGGAIVLVAKWFEFRYHTPLGDNVLASETIDSGTYDYDWTSHTTMADQRTSTSPTAVVETQNPTPRYLAYELETGLPQEPSQVIIAAQVANGTGVTVDGVELTWMEVGSPRQWGKTS